MSVSRDVLTLSISDGFETSRFKTNNIIKVTITPSSRNQISGVANSGIGNLVVGPGFLARMFTVSSKGSGNTYVFGLNTQKARVVSMGATTVLLNGNVSDGGSLEVDGTSKVYLTGAIGGTLAVNLDYQSSTYVQGTSGTVFRGEMYPLAELQYTAGTCRVQAQAPVTPFSLTGAPRCNKVQAGSAPSFTPSWSCGLQVEGKSVCPSENIHFPDNYTPPEMSVVRVQCLDPSPLNVF
ncbi:hypothetical protein V8C86DRAFT_1033000 [Haematococcus lacustris]